MIREVVLHLPRVVVHRGLPACRCGKAVEAGEHEPVRECAGSGGTGCHEPAAHHEYAPLPWWRRLRLGRSWEA